MRLNLLTRRVHYWASVFVALPLAVIICTGLLLQTKKQWTWVQPKEHRGTGTTPAVGFAEILSAVQGVAELGVDSWDDINRMDVRPGRGMVKVWLQSGWEVQVDLGTGQVLQTAYRRSDLIESIHDGSFFGGDWVKLGLFLPTGIVLLLMWGTGLWLFWLPISAKRKKRAKRNQAAAQDFARR